MSAVGPTTAKVGLVSRNVGSDRVVKSACLARLGALR